MRQLIQKPHLFFWGLVPLILLVSFLFGDMVYYLNAYDVHLAVPYRELGFLIAAVALALGTGYWMVLKCQWKLSVLLSTWHILLTMVGPIGALLASLMKREIDLPVTDVLQYAADTQHNDRLLLASYALWMVTILGQLVFPVNLIRARPKSAGKPTDTRGYPGGK